MNGPAAQKFQRLLSSIYKADYNTLRSAFYRRARIEGKKITEIIPDIKKETMRNYLVERIKVTYMREAMDEVRTQRQAPQILKNIFEQNTTQFENNRLFVNVPVIIEQATQQVPQFVPRIGEQFREWIERNRLDRVPIPPNRMLFLMRRNIANNGMEPVAWTAWRYPNGQYLLSVKNQRRFNWLDYVAGISQAMGIVNDPYFLMFDIVEPKREQPGFVRIGYNIYNTPGEKNCLVRILSPFVQNDVRQKFEEMTKDLIHKQDNPAFIAPDFIDRLGKLMRAKISLYSPYGAFKNIPTQVLGAGGNKKNFKIIVNNQHAHVFAPSIVNKVKYIDDITDFMEAAARPNLSTVIDVQENTATHNLTNTPWDYARAFEPEKKNVAGFITVDGFGTEAITTMNKFLRPSAITGRASDDENPALFNKTTPAGVFMYNFIRKNDLTIPPEFVARLASAAGRPFGTAYLRKQKKGGHVIEIDQNASYASYEFSPFYQGFPVGNWVKIAGAPTQQPDAELKPAFVEVAAMKVKAKNANHYDYAEMLGQLRDNFSVITYPEYLRWSEMFEIDVINTTYATFQHISVYDDLNALTERMRAACPPVDSDGIPVDVIPAYVKSMRNAFTGKLIQGGLDMYDALKTISTTSKTEFEIMIAEHERDFGELPHCEIVDSFGQPVYKITTRVNKPGHKFPHIYAYITAISRLSVLEKLAQLKEIGFKPVRVHVDAIYVRWVGKLDGKRTAARVAEVIPDIDPNTPGKFKAFDSYKTFDQPEPTQSAFNINDGQFYGIMSQSQPAAEGYPGHRKIVICGPGGVGKSTVAVNFLSGNDAANGRALYLTPTRELRGEMRDKLDQVGKNPSDCICLEGARRAIATVFTAEENGRRAPPEYLARLAGFKSMYTHIIIDEFGKTDGGDIDTIIEFAERYRKNVIMMGDYNQTIFSKDDGYQATREVLAEWGFMLFADPRNARVENKPMRHSYAWGSFLDSIADKPAPEQVEALRAYGIRVISVADELDKSGLVYCGNWATIARYNHALIANDTAQRLRTIGKKETLPYNPALKPLVWNKQAFAEHQPRGAKYTVDFAITVDCVQGSTVENPNQYIHVASLVNRWGAIYTAVTRSRTPEQITLII